MKKAFIMIACLTAMMVGSTVLKAQEVSITLIPGWTWISCPTTEAVGFDVALGDFTPMQGDVIKSQWGSAIYRNGQWKGNISQFNPGYGYHYKSNRTVPVVVTFNAQQPTSQVLVTTSEPMLITGNSAMGGGNVVSNDGTYIIVKGICWATHETPTSNDNYLEEGSGEGNFTATMTGLNFSATYYVRVYAVTPSGTVYGNQRSFTTVSHDYVDLGLPSGLLWATCNVGADNPEDYGDYFAWGETQPKDYYNWNTYQYSNGGFYEYDGSDEEGNFIPNLTKYCNDSYYGYNGFTDNLTTLLLEDDAAIANWENGWRMPTEAEWQELFTNTTVTWTTQNGVNGLLFTASNGSSLFLPAAGSRSLSYFYDAGRYGYYWSSSLTGYPSYAWGFYFNFNSYFNSCNSGMSASSRYSGHSVRPVRSSGQD